MKDSILTRLYKPILFDVVSVWLELKAVNFVDSAFCNSKTRNYILDHFRSPFLSVNCISKLNQYILHYINIRGLKLRDLIGDSSIFHDIIFFKLIPQK